MHENQENMTPEEILEVECPMADMLVEDVNLQIAKVKGVKSVNVILTFDPVWDKSMMSEEALLELNML